jgi:cation/acetate symporter
MNVSTGAVVGLCAMALATVTVGVLGRNIARTTSDLFVAARAVPPRLNAAAVSGEYLSAASFLGVAGLVMQFGYDTLWYPVGYAAGYLMLLVFIAGPLRRFGAYTIPDFAEGRFQSPRLRRLAVGLVVIIGLFYTLAQMKAAGVTVATAAGVPYATGVLVVAAVVALIVMSGGMRGITRVQAMQFAVKLFAISVPAFVLLIHFGTPASILADAGSGATPRLTQGVSLDIHAGDSWSVTEPTLVSLSSPVQAVLVTSGGGSRTTYVGVPLAHPGGTGGSRSDVVLSGTPTLPAGTVEWNGATTVGLTAGEAAPFGTDTPPSTGASWLRPGGPLAGGSGHTLLFTYSLIVAIVFGTMGLPHILVRFYTNPDARAARRTALYVLVFVGIFYAFPPLYGAIGRARAPQLYTGNLRGPATCSPAWSRQAPSPPSPRR